MEQDYRTLLARPASESGYRRLFASASDDAHEFRTLFTLMADADERVAWHAAWVCEKVSERSHHFFTGSDIECLVRLTVESPFAGVHRLALSMLLNLGLPDELPVDFINTCLDRMMSDRVPVAVQVLSLKLLHGFARREPDFATELLACLDAVDERQRTGGWQAAVRKIRPSLEALGASACAPR